MDTERRSRLQTDGRPSRLAGTLVLGIILLPVIHGTCLSLTSTKAEPFRTYAKITWSIASIAPGCSVLNWMVHYDSSKPVRIYQNRNNTGTYVNQSFVRVYPNFEYNVFVEAFTNQGVVRSPIFVYKAPKTIPGSAPGKLHMLSATHDSVTLEWDALSLFYKNGNILGYKLTYRLPGNSTVMSTSVSGENTLTGVIKGLQPSTHYQIQVQCLNDVGLGRPSRPWLDVTTSALPTTTSTSTTITTTTTTTTTITTPTTVTTVTTPTTTTTSSTTPTTTTASTTTPTTTTVKKQTITSPTTSTPTTTKTTPTSKNLPISVSITPAASNPKTSTPTTKSNQPSPPVRVHLTASGATSAPTSTTGRSVISLVTKKLPSNHLTNLIHTTTPSATTRKDPGDDKILGLDLWMLVAIAAGALLLLLLLSVLLCCCCRCCCFEEAAVGAKTRGEERVFDKRRMDGVFMERDARRNDMSRKTRTRSVVSMESLDGYGVNEVKPRAMRLVSVDSHHSLDAVPILIPSSAGRYSTRHNTPMSKTMGTQYERIHTTPRARAAGTQYEDVTERVIYPSPKSKTFGTQYESIEEEISTKDVGTVTDRRGSLTSSMSPFPPNTWSTKTPRTLRAVAPMYINPEVLNPIVVTTMDASTSAMSSPERRFKSANVQTDLSVLKPPTPLSQSYSSKSKSTGYPSSVMYKNDEAEIEMLPPRPLVDTTKSVGASSVSIPSTAIGDRKVPFSDIASCPTAVPLRPQDMPRTRDSSFLRYPSKAASHPITLWDIPLKSYPDSITYPSQDSSGDVTPTPINRIEYNTIYDNRVSNTDNTYIHNFLEDAKRMARKPKVSRPPRLAAIPANAESPVGLYDPFPEEGGAHNLIKPGLEKQTTFNNIPAVKGPEVRAILYEPHRLKDSTDC